MLQASLLFTSMTELGDTPHVSQLTVSPQILSTSFNEIVYQPASFSSIRIVTQKDQVCLQQSFSIAEQLQID